jgi:hypothetical protein
MRTVSSSATLDLGVRIGGIADEGAAVHRVFPRIRIHRRKKGRFRERLDEEPGRRDETESVETAANLMAKLEMDVFGHP